LLKGNYFFSLYLSLPLRDKRSNIWDNVEMIKVRKQLAEKCSALSAMERKFLHLQENQRNLKINHDVLIAKSDDLNLQLKEERLKCLRLENELQSVTITNRRIEEVRLCPRELESFFVCHMFYCSVFSGTCEQEWKLKEEQLKLQIAELETAVKSSLADKGEILDEIKVVKVCNVIPINSHQCRWELQQLMVFQYIVLKIHVVALVFFTAAQLRDVVYGTKQYKSRPEILPGNPVKEFDGTPHLTRGEGLFEIHISRVIFSSAAVHALGDHEPATFCTYAFYDFELQATPILHGHTLSYDCTSQYLVQIDDCFFHYVQNSSVTLEVHHAYGADYETVASCQLALHEILEQNGRIHGTAALVGMNGNIEDFGTIEYWIRLQVPIDQSVGLYKEKSKARGYTIPNFREHESPFQWPIPRTAQFSTSTDGDLNELHVTIKCCNNLQSPKKHLQPNSYVVYKFFDFARHDTHIIPSNSNPQIDDHVCFQMPMTADLDRYLKRESLTFYVFDDAEMGEYGYLGKANVPLVPLARNRSISDTFEITDSERRVIGTIRVELKWKFAYLPPSGAAVAADLENYIQNEKSMAPKLVSEQEMQPPDFAPSFTSSVTVPVPKPRRRAAQTDKKVSFLNASSIQLTVSLILSVLILLVIYEVKQERPADVKVEETAKEIQREKGDHSCLSEEQLTGQSSVTSGNETEITEELEPEETDSDDCIVTSPISKNIKQVSWSVLWKFAKSKKKIEKIRIEIISLGLTDSRIVQDETIQRLFVECRLQNFITEETPVSLPKPPCGQRVHYNFSNGKYNEFLIRFIFFFKFSSKSNLLFTVVSDPPEDEQDLECEDIGFAYVSLRQIFQKGRDVIELYIYITLLLILVLTNTVLRISITLSLHSLYKTCLVKMKYWWFWFRSSSLK
uniref:RPGRIP1 like n=1 Tax=Pavo cristatus TaxID=9049 RepID=A0A8C9FG95_PAVCR